MSASENPLSVLDVQKFLRQHAEQGHDILTDHRTVHIGEPTDPSEPLRPFGLAVKHKLMVYTNPKASNLTSTTALESDLMHGEKPTGTSLLSAVGHDVAKGKDILIFRNANKMHPSHEDPDDRNEHSFMYDFGENEAYHHYGTSLARPETSHPNIHEVLKAQANDPVKYFHRNDDVHRQNVTGWDINKALMSRSHPLEPFSGLLHVVHQNKEYVYSPKTEQLHRLD